MMRQGSTQLDATELVKEVADVVDIALDERLGKRDLPEALIEAMRYATLDGGKRLRPALVFASCDAIGGERDRVLRAAMAVELVHAFSLVHDDLPAMDDDDLRRGRATVHVQFGETLAILAGDALLAEAFAVLVDDEDSSAAVLRELAHATEQMIAGQVADSVIEQAGSEEDRLDQLEWTHTRKTGALIRASCRMGVLASEPNASGLSAITDFGEAIGLMYQIVDDLLDVEGSSQETGKRTSKDARAGKLTYPGEMGVERARERAEELHESALGALASLGTEADGLRGLSTLLVGRTG